MPPALLPPHRRGVPVDGACRDGGGISGVRAPLPRRGGIWSLRHVRERIQGQSERPRCRADDAGGVPPVQGGARTSRLHHVRGERAAWREAPSSERGSRGHHQDCVQHHRRSDHLHDRGWDVTTRAPLQPPPPVDAKLLDQVGLRQVESSSAYKCLRWVAADYTSGVLYASHLPIPWGGYWRSKRDVVEIVWSVELETILLLLDSCRQHA